MTTITIDLPDDVEPKLRSLAERFGSPDEAITRLIREAEDDTPPAKSPMRQHLSDLKKMAKPRGRDVSYDRAGFYPEAGR